VVPFSCPRCRREADERFYGPCGACRDELRAALAATAREVDAGGFEPSMHVTPNAVALKDD
jgi:hypothetical protein